jgi:predicted O-methyltransferase YrrM
MTNKERLKAIYSIFRKIVKYPASIFLVLKDETEYEKYLHKKYNLSQLPVTPLEQFFTNSEVQVSHYTFLDGTSMVTDLALLRSLASLIPNCEFLEIGTWRGESVMNVAQVASHCTSVNLSPEEIIARGFPEKYARLHACLIKNQPNITEIHADSAQFDFSSLNKKFDLIFVDGDHTYSGVKNDTKIVFDLLKNDDSVIVWHDYGYNPESPRHSVLAAILDGLPAKEHQNLYHVSNTMCAIYSKKKLAGEMMKFPVKPDKVFNLKIEVQKIEN